MKTINILFISFIFLTFLFSNVFAEKNQENSHSNITSTLLWLSLLIILSRIGSLVEKIKQPSVLGEILIGIIIGNLGLLGFNFLNGIKHDNLLAFLAELGVIILLFQIGLESNIAQMKKVGLPSLLVALIGVISPFLLGTYIVGPLFFPGLSFNTYLFLGATLTATSVGITARVFRDLGALNSSEAKIILGAAVIDDVLGLIVLAIVSAIVTTGSVALSNIIWITAKAFLFLLGAIILGNSLATYLSKLFSKIHTGVGMKFALALSFCFFFSFLSSKIGLAPIVGAFAAGLILDPVHFKSFSKPKIVEELEEFEKKLQNNEKSKLKNIIHHHSEHHIEDLVEPVAYLLVPLFFVYTGLGVDISSLFNLKSLILAVAITLVAIIGKYLSGVGIIFFKEFRNLNKNIIGFGMVPRGEVGLIFAVIGKNLGVINDTLFSIIVLIIIATTLISPLILSSLLRKNK
ncbi:MAG: hypothetical protein KatS3mg094_037 [Candidatus Parcubacteria bacterium]|nr:MAG: hypothetical protein KatS3mg094_037 [Candidatus Parcubacteria bacterium]